MRTVKRKAPQQFRFITFRVGDAIYAVSVLKVREIIRFPEITPVPEMPPHMLGFTHLRGAVIPVMDMRLKFGGTEAGISDRTCVIMIQLISADGLPVCCGLVVDAVNEVIALGEEDFDPLPSLGMSGNRPYFLGMAKWKEQLLTIIDIEQVVSTHDLINVANKEG